MLIKYFYFLFCLQGMSKAMITTDKLLGIGSDPISDPWLVPGFILTLQLYVFTMPPMCSVVPLLGADFQLPTFCPFYTPLPVSFNTILIIASASMQTLQGVGTRTDTHTQI